MRSEVRVRPKARIQSLEAASMGDPEILDEDVDIAGMESIVHLWTKEEHELTG